MSDMVEQVVVGSILGDGSIGKSGIYIESHSQKQEDYLLWKKSLFDNLIFDKKYAKIRMMHYYGKRNSCQLYVPRHSVFQEYREISYPDGKKRITGKFIKRIGKLAICVWYFDDGCYCAATNRIAIYSMCFSYEENRKLQRVLKERFGLNFRIQCMKRKIDSDYPYFLNCTKKKDVDVFLRFIKENAPYIPKSMTYKMGKLDKGNLKWIEEKAKSFQQMKKDYYQKNREKLRENYREFYQKNKEKINKEHHDYYIKNKEKRLKYNKEWRKNNPEKCREMARKWREKNREHYLEYHKEYRRKNRRGKA